MRIKELLEAAPDFIDKEMPVVTTGTTIDFYSEDTIKRDFTLIALIDYDKKKVVVVLSKTKKFAAVGFMGVRKEDKKVGMTIVGTVEFKDEPNIAYDRAIPTGKNVLQVDGVEILPKYKTKGYGFLLYLSLAKYGYVIISDNTQNRGGKVLWKKLAKLANAENYKIYILENGRPVLDDSGEPIKYDGTNIDDADIWAAPTTNIAKSKRYTLLMLRI